jgi:outer membrane protein
MMNKFSPNRCLLSWLGIAILSGISQVEAQEFTPTVDGDIGAGAYYTRSIIKGDPDGSSVLPYLDFKYSRMFARIDTFGVKTLALGYGQGLLPRSD